MNSSTRVEGSRSGIRVRLAAPADLDALLALEQASFSGDRMRRAQFRRHLLSDSALVLVAEAGGSDLLGSALVLFRRGSRTARLYSIARRIEARGTGVGAVLVAAVERAARARGCTRLRLEVRLDNAAARKLYQRLGFVAVADLPAYYEDASDGLRYEKTLSEPDQEPVGRRPAGA